MNGNATVSYKDLENNSRINKQNFLTNSDTYTYSWTDASSRNLNLATMHTMKLQPASENRYAARLQLDLTYQDNKDEKKITEGNFNTPQSLSDRLREEIEDGLSGDMDMINRYISRAESKHNDLNFHWDLQTTFSTGSSGGLSILAHGYYNRGNYRDNSAYLLQTAQTDGESVARRNPRDYHSYQNWMGLSYSWKINDKWTFSPTYGYCQWYEHNSDMWYRSPDSSTGSPDLMGNLPSVNDAMMVFDRPNSYTTGWRNRHHYISPSLAYYNIKYLDGKEYSKVRVFITPSFDVVSRRLDFHGETEQRVKRDYMLWEPKIFFGWDMRNMAPYLSLEYSYKTETMQLIDLVDVMFTTDPLNLKVGNPGLRNGGTHLIEALFNSRKWYFNRLLLNIDLLATFTHDKVAMGYSYDRTTGVKRWMPVNVNGNRYGYINFNTTLSLDRHKRFLFKNTLWFYPRRSVDMLSYDEFESTHKSIVNSLEINENARFEYTFGKNKNMIALDFKVTNRKATSPDLDVHDVNITRYSYGVRGRAALPWNIEFTTDLKMYSNRGFENKSMNDNQLVWNARLQKKFPKTGISIIIDGYDILGNVKNISYQIDSQGRTEKWVNSVPDYVMLSLRWDFSKMKAK